MLSIKQLFNDIIALKEEKNAIILAHVYQNSSIQDIADFRGDSLALSKKAMNVDAEIILFCGVKFMAETASILNPKKIVLLPNTTAGCNLADMASVQQLKSIKKQNPDSATVCYINSSVEIKAESDICCTSANAVEMVNLIKEDSVIFLPDKNLGSYVAEHTSKKIILWDGYCYVHEDIQIESIMKLQKSHPSAEVIVHPECNKKVRDLADYIGGTAGMNKYVMGSNCKEFIVGTEDNFIHHLKKNSPSKEFYPLNTTCQGMGEISLLDIKDSLEKNQHEIHINQSIRLKALKTLEKMMKYS